MIPAAAVEAATRRLAAENGWEGPYPEGLARAALEAAAPYIQAAALREAVDHLEYGNPIKAVEAAAKAAYEVIPVELFGDDHPVTWEQLSASILGQARKAHELRRAKLALEAAMPLILAPRPPAAEPPVWWINRSITTTNQSPGSTIPTEAITAAAHMLADVSAELAYQTARAEYYRYAPEIEHDPKGVERLRAEMRRLRPTP